MFMRRLKRTAQKVQVADTEEKMKTGRLKWFDHCLSLSPDATVHRCEIMVGEGTKRNEVGLKHVKESCPKRPTISWNPFRLKEIK